MLLQWYCSGVVYSAPELPKREEVHQEEVLQATQHYRHSRDSSHHKDVAPRLQSMLVNIPGGFVRQSPHVVCEPALLKDLHAILVHAVWSV